MRFGTSFLMAAALGLCSSAVMATTYTFDAATSKVMWVGKKISGQHNGTVNLKSGELSLEKKSGSFVIDMNSIECEDLQGEWNQKLVGHLKSDDFFNVSKYPEAKFVVSSLEKTSGDQYKISGNLTVKDITKPVSFTATISTNKDDATMSAKFSIDRTKWDIKYNSGKFFDVKALGDKLILDPIEIGLELKAVKAAKAS